jgi:hypothetical protein
VPSKQRAKAKETDIAKYTKKTPVNKKAITNLQAQHSPAFAHTHTETLNHFNRETGNTITISHGAALGIHKITVYRYNKVSTLEEVMKYPQSYAMTVSLSAETDYLQIQIVGALLMSCTLCLLSFSTQADQDTNSISLSNTPFYKQLQPLTTAKTGKSFFRNNRLQRLMADDGDFDIWSTGPAYGSPAHDNDLAFNYLWMQQNQQNYRQKAGGAAFGILVRRGLKSLYKTHGGSGLEAINDDDFRSDYSDLDYRLRLSSDKIKLGIEYQF